MFGSSKSATQNLDPAQVRDLLAQDAITLVDVREDDEWAAERIAGAIHVPLSRLQDMAAGIPTAKPVVFYCVVGGRSGRAVDACRSLGLPHDSHMAGGLQSWKAQGLPVAR